LFIWLDFATAVDEMSILFQCCNLHSVWFIINEPTVKGKCSAEKSSLSALECQSTVLGLCTGKHMNKNDQNDS
jgi:hypothetical protein